MAKNIKRELKKKATGSRDVKLDDQKATVSISVTYPDTSAPTSDWSRMVDKIFAAVSDITEEFEQQGTLPLGKGGEPPENKDGIGGDGDKE